VPGQHDNQTPWAPALQRHDAAGNSAPLSWVPGALQATLDWSEDAMEIAEEETSGTAPPVAV